jgi:import receptor subunit TOM20
MKSSEVEPSQESTNESTLIKELLASKVPGIDTFLTDEIYLLLKGKLNTNTFAVCTDSEEITQDVSI